MPLRWDCVLANHAEKVLQWMPLYSWASFTSASSRLWILKLLLPHLCRRVRLFFCMVYGTRVLHGHMPRMACLKPLQASNQKYGDSMQSLQILFSSSPTMMHKNGLVPCAGAAGGGPHPPPQVRRGARRAARAVRAAADQRRPAAGQAHRCSPSSCTSQVTAARDSTNEPFLMPGNPKP